MNRLAKIEYRNGTPEFLVIDGNKLSRFDLLAMAADSEDEKFAWEVMKIASKLFHWQDDKTFNSLYGSVAMEIVSNFIVDEFTVHQMFYDYIAKLPNARIIKRKNNPAHQPDAWVICDEEFLMPVEIKLKDFNHKSLKQLKRYMDFYNCGFGIAVAKNLKVKLPENIKFISISELR